MASLRRSGTGPDRAGGALVDRGPERAILTAALGRAAAAQPWVVLVEGEAGIGKTHLVRDVFGDASVRRCQAQADERERYLAYGVLDQLVGGRLWPHGRPDRVEDPLTVGTRLIDVLGDLQAREPVVVTIDDAQWADAASLQALVFTLRRLRADRVLTVLAARSSSVWPARRRSSPRC